MNAASASARMQPIATSLRNESWDTLSPEFPCVISEKNPQGKHAEVLRLASSKMIPIQWTFPWPFRGMTIALTPRDAVRLGRWAFEVMQTMLPPPMRLVLVLAVVVGFDVRAGAQSGQHRTALLQLPPSPMIVSPPRHALPFASSGLVTQGHGDFHGSYGFRITRDYRLQNPGSLSSFQETKTSFATESRLPVAQIWGARVQLNFFVVTLYSRNVMLGPLASNEAFHPPKAIALCRFVRHRRKCSAWTKRTVGRLERPMAQSFANCLRGGLAATITKLAKWPTKLRVPC